MESTSLLQALWSTQTPLLPGALPARLYLALGWGLVLAGAALWWLSRTGLNRSRWTRWLPLALLLWCLVPGPVSPAYWLGLAFRAPSLLFAFLCAWALLAHELPQQLAAPPLPALRRWLLGPVLLGWLLLLDTLALWPVSLYALGFAPLTLGVLGLLALLPWLLRGEGRLAVLLALVLLAYVLLRLPSGNVWDALIDPWLWIVLQLDGLRRKLRRT